MPVVKVMVQLIQDLHEGIEGLNQQIQEAAEAHPDFFARAADASLDIPK